jgi:inosose dehydratase
MSIKVASAPVSWGIMEEIEVPAEYPYTRVLDEIAQAGYRGTELGPYGYLPSQPQKLAEELKKRQLSMCSAFIEFHLGDRSRHREGIAQVETTAALISQLGAKLLVLSDAITPERSAVAGRREEANRLSWSEAGWKAAEDGVAAVIGSCRKFGLGVAFHHHVGTHVETPEEVERLLTTVQDRALGLCLDTGHYLYGGGDPVDLVKRHADRMSCLHLKDIDAQRLKEARERKLNFHDGVRHGVFAPLGQGVIDFAAIVKHLQVAGFAGWVVVEQDVLEGGTETAKPLVNATAGREYLRSLGI